MKLIKNILDKIKFGNGFSFRLQKLEDNFESLQEDVTEVEDHIRDIRESIERIERNMVDEDTLDNVKDDLDDKVDQCDFDDLKDSVDGVCNEIKDIDNTIDGIQQELTKYVIENSKLRRAIKALANTPYLESVVDNILKETEDGE